METGNKFHQDRSKLEREMASQQRESEFYSSKVKGQFEYQLGRLDQLTRMSREVRAKRDRAMKLDDSLEDFRGLTATNESLLAKIEELKKNRLSLEMSFVESPQV